MVGTVCLTTNQKQIKIQYIKNRYKIMNKQEFVKHIITQHKCNQDEANKAIDMFTSSVISALGEGGDISLVGFGNFSVSKVESRPGRNPKTGEAIQIKAYNQPKLKVGQKLKDAVNGK